MTAKWTWFGSAYVMALVVNVSCTATKLSGYRPIAVARLATLSAVSIATGARTVGARRASGGVDAWIVREMGRVIHMVVEFHRLILTMMRIERDLVKRQLYRRVEGKTHLEGEYTHTEKTTINLRSKMKFKFCFRCPVSTACVYSLG
jgi:hypothetical protein